MFRQKTPAIANPPITLYENGSKQFRPVIERHNLWKAAGQMGETGLRVCDPNGLTNLELESGYNFAAPWSVGSAGIRDTATQVAEAVRDDPTAGLRSHIRV
jgi:hypothetical protein